MIQIKNVSKIYGTKKSNIDITTEIKQGDIYGLIGPNGAGKTTLIRQLMGYTKPTSGEIKIIDTDPFTNRENIINEVGYLPAELSFPSNIKGISFLKEIAFITKNVDMEFMERLIKLFDLEANTKIKKMSTGMKKKLALISVAMRNPKLLILDEPTASFDPLLKNVFLDFMKQLNSRGTTILLSSHDFVEVERICNRVGFVKEGKLIKEFDLTNKAEKNNLEKDFMSMYEKNTGDIFND